VVIVNMLIRPLEFLKSLWHFFQCHK